MPAPIQLVESSGGVAVAVHDLGGPDHAPVIVFVHATGFNAHAWRPFAAALAPRHRVVALDLRAHGVARTPEDVDLTWTGFGDDVVAVLDSGALPPGPLHGVGHSMGGAALCMAAARRPWALRSLWLFEPIVPPPDGFADDDGTVRPNPLAEGAERRRRSFESLDAALDNYASKPPLGSFHPDALRGYVEGGFEAMPDGTVTLRCRPEWEAATFRMAAGNPAWEALPSIDIPTTVAVGEDVEMGPSRWSPDVAARLPKGRLLDHPELTHFGPMEAPEILAADVERWVAGG
jgi:pimeloyl-ACP methyl ester carboxylesterase